MTRLIRIKLNVLLFVLLAFTACQQPSKTESVKTNTKITLKTAPVTRSEISDTISIFGELALRQEAWLSSQFEGRLTQFSMLEGDKVQKGELAGMIIPARREALLQATDSISDELKPLLAKQEYSIQLFCPITGIVLEVKQHTGDVVSKGGHIAHIGDLSVLDVQGELPVQFLDVARKAKKLKVEFTNFSAPPMNLPIETFTGEVSQNQSLKVRLKLNNPSSLYRPGMRVKISFPTSVHTSALLVLRQALVEEEGEYFLFTVNEGKTQKQKVEVGIMKDDIVEIKSGVEEKQQIAIEKAYSLKDNMEVITR